MPTNNQMAQAMGIVGAGLMGRGIAQIAIQGGISVVLHDSRPNGALEAKDAITVTLNTLAAKGKISSDDAAASVNRLVVAETLDDLSSCTVVVEAIVEKLEAKRDLFQQLEKIVGDDCILATNTSSLSITEIAATCRKPGRVAGFHFFSPVPLMKVVEVITGPLTDQGIGAMLVAIVRQMGHAPVQASDTPGFIVNHAGRGYLTESLRLLGETVAPHQVIDTVLRQGAGFRMGPFELLDLTGLDVSQPVMESIYHQYYQEPRFRPSPIARQRQAAGLLGRKTQSGFYRYENGKKQDIPLPTTPTRNDLPVWLDPVDAASFPAVVQLLRAVGAPLDTGEIPSEKSICLLLPIGQDVTTKAISLGLDPIRCLGMDPLFLDGCRTLMTNPATGTTYRDSLHAMIAAADLPVVIIQDSPGFVSQRVIAAIVNIGCDIAQQGIATPEDIDLAVTLGLGYPHGPLAMGDLIGPVTVLRILDGLFDFYRDPRYRPSPWLKRRALLGLSLLTSSN